MHLGHVDEKLLNRICDLERAVERLNRRNGLYVFVRGLLDVLPFAILMATMAYMFTHIK